jgi:hypothetical protein
MNGTAVAIVRWPGRWVCWDLSWSDNGRMNGGDSCALSWTFRRVAGLGLAANLLSTLPQNSVSLTFLTLKFDRENFPKIHE